MKKVIRKAVCLFAVLAVLMTAFTGCSRAGSEEKGLRKTAIFTDSCGREVAVPANISRVAVTGPVAQIAVYAFAPELLVGWASTVNDSTASFIPEAYRKLPVIGQLYGGSGEINLEELLNLSPDVVVDMGETKGSIGEDMDKLSEQTGIPFVHIDTGLLNMSEAFLKLGELTGMADRAAEYADYCSGMLEKVADIVKRPSSDKARSLFCVGNEGTNVIAKGSYHSETFDLLTDNIAIVGSPSAKGTGNETDLEQILLWDPDFILFGPDSVYEEVADDPAWQKVTAIKNGNYACVPSEPYNWMGFPPSVQRYLGMLWLAKILYPEKADYDLEDEVTGYFRMFYHTELTDREYYEESFFGGKFRDR